MKIAVEGCAHGELDSIYAHIARLEQRHGYTVELLLICGDFQAVRNEQDLQCMAVPDKYKELREFYKYYTGEKTAPILTIVIGGNHEASNYMWELFHGGWLAPNIYFLGAAGCVQVRGVRIAGASGIFKAHDFRKGFFERLPYDRGTMRSVYHVREFSVRRLSLLAPPRIFLSHDWPAGVERHGDVAGLLRRKRFFRADVEAGALGSPPMMGLLRTLRPAWWFAAHLHTRFEAAVVHDGAGPGEGEERGEAAGGGGAAGGANPDEIVIEDDECADAGAGPAAARAPDAPAPAVEARAAAAARNPDEILLDDEEEAVAPPAPAPAPPPPAAPTHTTRFLALDKCLPRRDFLEVVDVPAPAADGAARLAFDAEWLAITRAFHPWFTAGAAQRAFPDEAHARALVRDARAWVAAHVGGEGAAALEVARWQTFVRTAPGPAGGGMRGVQQPRAYSNPQTEAFCRMLQIDNKINQGAAN